MNKTLYYKTYTYRFINELKIKLSDLIEFLLYVMNTAILKKYKK